MPLGLYFSRIQVRLGITKVQIFQKEENNLP